MSEFSSVPIFGWSLTITSDKPQRTCASVIIGSLFLLSALFVLFYPFIDEIHRMTIFPLLMGGFAISNCFVGKKQRSKAWFNQQQLGLHRQPLFVQRRPYGDRACCRVRQASVTAVGLPSPLGQNPIENSWRSACDRRFMVIRAAQTSSGVGVKRGREYRFRLR